MGSTPAASAPPGAGELVAQVVPSGPGFATENNLRMFTTLIYGAQRRLSITSPYFVPDESLLYAITTAAQRGVDVELFVSEAGDQFMVYHAQRSYYQALLEAGVRIWLYPAPYVLHSKHFSVDDDVAVIGSSNMDLRSFALNYEVSLMLTGPGIVERMREVEDTYRALSRELTEDEWSDRSRGSRVHRQRDAADLGPAVTSGRGGFTRIRRGRPQGVPRRWGSGPAATAGSGATRWRRA